MVIDGEEVDSRDVEFDVAQAVYDRIRRDHRKCDPESCALSRVWVEDVQEIVDAIREVTR